LWEQWNKEWKEDLYHQDGILALSRSFKVREVTRAYLNRFSECVLQFYNIIIAHRGCSQDGNFIYETCKTLKKRKYPVEDLDRSTIAKRYPAW
jgi:hypothetical protein